MFIIGKASDEEIVEMQLLGFNVEPVDIKHFDKALSPNGEFNPEDYEDSEKMVAVFLDYDIVQECRDIGNV